MKKSTADCFLSAALKNLKRSHPGHAIEYLRALGCQRGFMVFGASGRTTIPVFGLQLKTKAAERRASVKKLGQACGTDFRKLVQIATPSFLSRRTRAGSHNIAKGGD